MKRYLLFGYDVHYPAGGVNDFIFASDEFHEVRRKILSMCSELNPSIYQIVDTKQHRFKSISLLFTSIGDSAQEKVMKELSNSSWEEIKPKLYK